MRKLSTFVSVSTFALAATAASGVEFYNVSSYASPQHAINAAAAAGGGVVRFPCGTTTISAPLTVTSPGITLEGCGPGGTILETTATTGNMIELGNPASAFAPCGGVRDMTLYSSGRTSGNAILVSGCQEGSLENLHIETHGGDGVQFSDSNDSLAAIFFVRRLTVWIDGAFTAIKVLGSSERHFSNLWLQGSSTAGSKGISITRSGGDWFKDIESVLFEIGVELSPPAGSLVGWLNFDNVLADTNTLHGFNFDGSGAISGVSCMRCWASSNGMSTTAGRGFRVAAGAGLTFTDSRVINNGGHGVEVGGAPTDIAIQGGIFAGNCLAPGCTNGLAHGIVMVGTKGFRISGVRAGQSMGSTNRQGYGIYVLNGSNNYIITNNDTRTNVSGGILNAPGVSATRILNSNI